MAFYVYVIQSDVDGSYYKGFSEDPLARLAQHNNGGSTYTSAKTPWNLVHLELYDTKREALIREKALKKYSHDQILRLIQSPKNIISRFGSSIG